MFGKDKDKDKGKGKGKDGLISTSSSFCFIMKACLIRTKFESTSCMLAVPCSEKTTEPLRLVDVDLT